MKIKRSDRFLSHQNLSFPCGELNLINEWYGLKVITKQYLLSLSILVHITFILFIVKLGFIHFFLLQNWKMDKKFMLLINILEKLTHLIFLYLFNFFFIKKI